MCELDYRPMRIYSVWQSSGAKQYLRSVNVVEIIFTLLAQEHAICPLLYRRIVYVSFCSCFSIVLVIHGIAEATSA